MRRKQSMPSQETPDDADAAAGLTISNIRSLPTPPPSRGGVSVASNTDLEFYEDLIAEPVLVFGTDISHLPRQSQFLLCASGVFFFSLLYGFLQELISVQLVNRQLGLFLATVQFIGYTLLSFLMRTYVYQSQKKKKRKLNSKASDMSASTKTSNSAAPLVVPFALYLGLSLLRAVDLGMTNLAMQYINYPAKTLMKSSRIVFTMFFGVLITKKRYKFMDYFVAMCIVAGLVIFMHADANSSAVFQPLGVVMLTVSLLCDGAITNMSEKIMNQYGVGQDEFIFRMYSIALVAISAAASVKGDLNDGIAWMLQPGTLAEQQSNVPLDERTWSVGGKIATMILFSTMGFFGSSCSAAITKNFGALTMSITSTARKATTLFLSFLLFDNECTMEHVLGIIVFISALVAKSLRRKGKSGKKKGVKIIKASTSSGDLELGSGPAAIMVPPASRSFDTTDILAGSRAEEGQTSTYSRRSPDIYPGAQLISDARIPSSKARYHIV